MIEEEDAREEQYELDAVMMQLQHDWRRLRASHHNFTRSFKDELDALLRASQSLLPEQVDDVISCGPLEASLLSGRCTWRGRAVPLSHMELKLTSTLAKRPDQLYDRDFLMSAFIPDGDSDRLVDSHIKRIRRKFEAVDRDFRQIYTIYSAGYRWNP